ncbi:MAG: hypothetical protein Q9169_004672 [Polycauliona sp. 2 TL-2023]
MVRITLTRFTGYRIPPAWVIPFIRNAVSSLDQTASREGGPRAPLGPDTKTLEYINGGLGMFFNDISSHNPEVGGGRTRFDEVRHVYQAIGDVMPRFGYEDCHVDAWRMVDGRSQKFKVKFLLSGVLVNQRSPAGRGLSVEANATADIPEAVVESVSTSTA